MRSVFIFVSRLPVAPDEVAIETFRALYVAADYALPKSGAAQERITDALTLRVWQEAQ